MAGTLKERRIRERIHITGASGSGTSTLGRILAGAIGGRHLDTDDYFWLPGDPPCQDKRPAEKRLSLLMADADPAGCWVLSGSLCGWGDPLIPRFDLVILLTAPTPLRLERLRCRETKRFGAAAIAENGSHHAGFAKFIAWAARYDDGGMEDRSRAGHDHWLSALPCPSLRLDGTRPLPELLALAMA